MVAAAPSCRPGTGPCAPEIELSSDALFDGAKTLSIVHGGERYLLRITRQNKLILTK